MIISPLRRFSLFSFTSLARPRLVRLQTSIPLELEIVGGGRGGADAPGSEG